MTEQNNLKKSDRVNISNGINPVRDSELSFRERVFVVCGANYFSRRQALANIKKRALKGHGACLNVLTFYSKEVNVKDLREKVLSESFSGNRIAVFKDFPALSSPVKDFLFNNLKKILAVNYAVFETEEDYYHLRRSKKISSDKFFNLIFEKAALFKAASSSRKSAIGDFIAGINKRDLASSLYVLESLFEGGNKEKVLGPQILGVLVNRFSAHKRKDVCFKYLWEADRAIKVKGQDARLALETLLVKLFAL